MIWLNKALTTTLMLLKQSLTELRLTNKILIITESWNCLRASNKINQFKMR